MARTKKSVLAAQSAAHAGAVGGAVPGLVYPHPYLPPGVSPSARSPRMAGEHHHMVVEPHLDVAHAAAASVFSPGLLEGDPALAPVPRKRPADAADLGGEPAVKYQKLEAPSAANATDVAPMHASAAPKRHPRKSEARDDDDDDSSDGSDDDDDEDEEDDDDDDDDDDRQTRRRRSRISGPREKRSSNGPGLRSRRQYEATWNTLAQYAKRKFPEVNLVEIPVDLQVPKIVESYIHQRCVLEGCGLSFAAIVRSSVKYYYKYVLNVPDSWTEQNRGNPADSQSLKDFIKNLEVPHKKEDGDKPEPRKRSSGRAKNEGEGRRKRNHDENGDSQAPRKDVALPLDFTGDLLEGIIATKIANAATINADRFAEEIGGIRSAYKKDTHEMTLRIERLEKQMRESVDFFKRITDAQRRAIEHMASFIKANPTASGMELNLDAILGPELQIPIIFEPVVEKTEPGMDGVVAADMPMGEDDPNRDPNNKSLYGLLKSWMGEGLVRDPPVVE